MEKGVKSRRVWEFEQCQESFVEDMKRPSEKQRLWASNISPLVAYAKALVAKWMIWISFKY